MNRLLYQTTAYKRTIYTAVFIVILCHTKAQTNWELRLANTKTTSTYIEGRVEVFLNDVPSTPAQWGTICDDLWSDVNAELVCEQLGYLKSNARGIKATPIDGNKWQPAFGEGTGVIWLVDVNCERGIHTSIKSCPQGGYNKNNCDHTEDAGVRCLLANKPSPVVTTTERATVTEENKCNKPTSEIRLHAVSGRPEGVGYVQVYNRKTSNWGLVCDDFWDVNDAKVVCRMLCYQPEEALPGAQKSYLSLPSVDGEVILSRLDCIGSESDIYSCPNIEWFKPNQTQCGVKEAASVTCKAHNPPPPSEPDPAIVCEDSAMTVTFSRINDPYLTISGVTADNSTGDCDAKSVTVNQDRDIAITVPYDKCNTHTEMTSADIIHTTSISYSSPISQDNTRRKNYFFNVRCVFPRNGTLDQGAVIPEAKVIEKSAQGQYVFVMEIYQDSTFKNTVTQFPLNVTLGEWLNVGVILRNTYTGVKLIVDTCRVMPTKSGSAPNFNIIDKKCPSNQVTVFPKSRTTFNFNFQTFKFSGSYDELYIECDAIVCQASETDKECDQSCQSRRRRGISGPIKHQLFTVHSAGPIKLFSNLDSQKQNLKRVLVGEGGIIRASELSNTNDRTVIVNDRFSLLSEHNASSSRSIKATLVSVILVLVINIFIVL